PGNLRQHDAPVLLIAISPDQLALLQPVEQARDIGVPRDHPLPGLGASQPVRRSAQDAQNVVLRRRKIFTFQQLRNRPRKRLRRPREVQKSYLFRTRRPRRPAFGFVRTAHLPSIYSLQRLLSRGPCAGLLRRLSRSASAIRYRGP